MSSCYTQTRSPCFTRFKVYRLYWVSIENRQRAGHQRNRCSFPDVRDKRIPSPKRSDQKTRATQPPNKWASGAFTANNEHLGRKLNTQLHLLSRLITVEIYAHPPPTLRVRNSKFAPKLPNSFDPILTFKRRIKYRLPFAGIIRSSSYSTRLQDKG